jgi:hypothetical protein
MVWVAVEVVRGRMVKKIIVPLKKNQRFFLDAGNLIL